MKNKTYQTEPPEAANALIQETVAAAVINTQLLRQYTPPFMRALCAGKINSDQFQLFNKE